MALFSFMDGPTVEAFSPAEFLDNAFNQPFSASQTFGQSVVGGALSSFGLGTAIKAGSIDGGRKFVPIDDANREPPVDLGAPQIRPETDAEVTARGDMVLNQDQYKASPYYRPQIPWDDSMTVNRAKAISQYADAQSVRDEMAKRRPWTAAAGTFAGSALDPINYVPVLGEGATAAAVGRFGVIGGRALVSSTDAAANVGIAGLLTAPIRSQYGDDVSWQSTVSQIAMGAALGAGFGALGGVLKMRSDARAEAIRADVEQRLSTIRAGQDSMASLHEAVAGLANDGEVRLGDDSLDRLDTLHASMADAVPEAEGRIGTIPETPATYANRVLAETMPEDMRRLSELDTAIANNIDELSALRTESMDNERFGSTRAAFIQAKELDAKYQRLSDATDKANSDKQRAQLQKQMADIQAKVQAIFDKLDPATIDRLDELDRVVPLREKALADAKAAREPVAGKIEAARQDIQQRYLSEPLPADAQAAPRVGMSEPPALPAPKPAKAIPASRAPREIVSTQPKPETPASEPIKAAKEVGKPETMKTVAEQHSVNPETGEFPEQFELDQLDKEGRMTEEDKAAMAVANDNYKAAKSWGEALKAAVACLI